MRRLLGLKGGTKRSDLPDSFARVAAYHVPQVLVLIRAAISSIVGWAYQRPQQHLRVGFGVRFLIPCLAQCLVRNISCGAEGLAFER